MRATFGWLVIIVFAVSCATVDLGGVEETSGVGEPVAETALGAEHLPAPSGLGSHRSDRPSDTPAGGTSDVPSDATPSAPPKESSPLPPDAGGPTGEAPPKETEVPVTCDGGGAPPCAVCTPGARESCPSSCGTAGEKTCGGNGQWGGCQAPTEICGNGVDDNCDGRVDEGCAVCTPGVRQSCQSSCGTAGEKTCGGNGQWGGCEPRAEICGNGIDDNCDGRVDEGCVVTCESQVGGRCGDNNSGAGDKCGPGQNTYGCAPEKFWAWCNRSNPAYPDIWYNYTRGWVASHCDGTVHVADFDGDGRETFYCDGSNGVTYTCNTPLVLSFEPNEPVSFGETASSFELLPGARATCFAWPGKTTPFLALDRDFDGMIGDGRELFGSATLLGSGGRARHGFEALAELDDNRDGLIDELDRDFPRLVAWYDGNGDGVSQPEELVSIADLGVVALSLSYEVRVRCDGRGNCERERSTLLYRGASGAIREGALIDVHFAVRHGCDALVP